MWHHWKSINKAFTTSPHIIKTIYTIQLLEISKSSSQVPGFSRLQCRLRVKHSSWFSLTHFISQAKRWWFIRCRVWPLFRSEIVLEIHCSSPRAEVHSVLQVCSNVSCRLCFIRFHAYCNLWSPKQIEPSKIQDLIAAGVDLSLVTEQSREAANSNTWLCWGAG